MTVKELVAKLLAKGAPFAEADRPKLEAFSVDQLTALVGAEEGHKGGPHPKPTAPVPPTPPDPTPTPEPDPKKEEVRGEEPL